MSQRTILSVTLCVAGLTSLGGPSRAATGTEPSASGLRPEVEELHREIQAERTRRPAAFAAVGRLRQQLERGAIARDRRALVGRTLRGLGREGLYPLMSVVDEDLSAMPHEAREILLVGALEALGRLREPRAVPLFERFLFAAQETERPAVVRSAAEALGLLCGDKEIGMLAGLSETGRPWRREAVSGLRGCRRMSAAAVLWDRLAERPGEDLVVEIAESLGYLGSSWAWQALGPERRQEGEQIRAVTVQALAAAYPRYQGRAREAIESALLMIDHPATPAAMDAMGEQLDGLGRSRVKKLFR